MQMSKLCISAGHELVELKEAKLQAKIRTFTLQGFRGVRKEVGNNCQISGGRHSPFLDQSTGRASVPTAFSAPLLVALLHVCLDKASTQPRATFFQRMDTNPSCFFMTLKPYSQ